jgi:hypothetical protein
MSQKSTPSFVDEAVGLLVQHFGADRVQIALSKVANGAVKLPQNQHRRPSSRSSRPTRPSVASTLEQMRSIDERKYQLLADFFTRLNDRRVLADSQDIRQFAQLIGLKEIGGKSRKDMVISLMRFLLEQPAERLRVEIEMAASISEEQRQEGFSVLTDKLLGGASS